jgi:hypothetical protein
MLSTVRIYLNFIFLTPSSLWSRQHPTYKLTTSEVSLGGRGGKTPIAANGKWRKTKILRLEREEGVIEGEENLKTYITSYYKKLFGKAK